MNQLRYHFTLAQIAELEHITQHAAEIITRFRFPETPSEQSYVAHQLDILTQHLSTSSRMRRSDSAAN